MLDRSTFVGYVREAFAHLDDPSFLMSHPLASLLSPPGRSATPDSLRRALIATIDQLRPPERTRPHSANWRRWQCLVLRYVEGATTQRIAQQLQTSDRQTRRDHVAGVDAVAAILWSRHREQLESRHRLTVPGTSANPIADGDAPTQPGDLEVELTRLSASTSGQSTDVGEALASVLATVKPLADNRRATIHLSIAEGLRRVGANETTVRQILLCALSWALHGREAPTLDLLAADSGQFVQLTLSVTPGRPSIAGPEAVEAQGLVETARRLSEAEGGLFRLDALPSGGARMSVTMPAGHLSTVLVVDDNPDVVQLFRRYLIGSPYRLVQARTPSAAFELARSLRPAIITLDVMMPSQDGWQMLQQLRTDAATHDIPVVICSVLPERVLAESLGVAAFLPKPVTPRSLRAALERCLTASPAARPDCP